MRCNLLINLEWKHTIYKAIACQVYYWWLTLYEMWKLLLLSESGLHLCTIEAYNDATNS
jgi:hypothetical protein